MNDLLDLIDTSAAYVGAHRASFIVAGLSLTVAVLALLVRRAIKGGRPDKWLTIVAQVLGYSWTGEAMWHIATTILHVSPWFAGFAFFVFESMQFVQILRAERRQKLHGNPGKYGRAAWQIAFVMAVVAALSGTTLVEVCLRFAVPILVTKLWWDGLTGDGVTEDTDAITWTWDRRRILVALGLAKPGEQTLEAADRARQIHVIAKVTHRKHTTGSKWLRARYGKRLGKLAMNADDSMLDAARAKVERVWRADDRTRPLNPQEHTLITEAKAQVAAATERAEAAEAQQQHLREAHERTARVALQAQEQVAALQQELDRTRREHHLAIEQLRHETAQAIQASRSAVPAQANGRNGHATTNGHGGNGHHTLAALTRGGHGVTTLLPAQAEDSAAEPEVPATAAGCVEWMEIWIKVCQEAPAFALGQPSGLTEDQAKTQFGRGLRHLRKVRQAARGGLLRKKALEAGAELPAGFTEQPGQPADRAAS
jgi:hypothetical protein